MYYTLFYTVCQLVLLDGVEPSSPPYQRGVLPLQTMGANIGGNRKSRTFTGHRMKVLHYRYATLPY